MAQLTEAQVRDPVIRWSKKMRIYSIRMYFGPGVSRGWPDDLFLIPGGRPVFIEFKAPGKRATKLQLRKIAVLEALGYDVFVFDNSELAIENLQWALDEALK